VYRATRKWAEAAGDNRGGSTAPVFGAALDSGASQAADTAQLLLESVDLLHAGSFAQVTGEARALLRRQVMAVAAHHLNEPPMAGTSAIAILGIFGAALRGDQS
jgi:hypothetical protein